MSAAKPVLYGGALSYFSGKARSYLHYKQVDFEERLATSDVYKDIIIARIGYPMIPVMVMADDHIIQDTSELIDYFEHHKPEPGVVPAQACQRLVSALMELYGDEWLLLPAMHYRWAHNRDFAIAEFGTLAAPDASTQEQYVAGEKTSKKFEGAVALLGATPEMAASIEASYVALLHELDRHFTHHDFLLGARPCAGDFGLIGPLYAHLYRDPASGALMQREAPAVARWVERMIRVPFTVNGDYLPDDEIAPTLIPVLKRMMAEQGPCLLDIFAKTTAFKEQDPTAKIPRAVGMHSFTVAGETGTRVVLPYSQWMAQRAFEPVAALSTPERARVKDLLHRINGEAFADLTFATPVRRENHRLVWRG